MTDSAILMQYMKYIIVIDRQRQTCLYVLCYAYELRMHHVIKKGQLNESW